MDTSLSNVFSAILVVFLCLILLTPIAYVVIRLFRQKNKKKIEIVKEHSALYRQLIDLNSETKFNEVKRFHELNEYCNSKRNFDRLQLIEMFKAKIETYKPYFKKAIDEVEDNIKKYEIYRAAYNDLKLVVTPLSSSLLDTVKNKKISLKKFYKLEQKLYIENELITPVVDIAVRCIASYISPQGRSRHRKEFTYSYGNLKFYFQEVLGEIKNRETRDYQIRMERAKMTDSVRFDILKRDGYKCQICGLAANDGVRLEIDHIYPVSKGGKTENSNLQTLCERCNRGKRDKLVG